MKTICFDVFPREEKISKMRRVLVKKHGFTEKENRYGVYFHIEVPDIDAWQIKSVLNTRGYKYKLFDRRYERSSDYRKKFFETRKGPYRCVYCGRRLKTDLEVDHLIPVSKAKNNTLARIYLRLSGATSVNDVKNLVPSCKKCNRKKSDKIGFWAIRGLVGRHDAFWKTKDCITLALAFIATYIVFRNLDVYHVILSAVERFSQ